MLEQLVNALADLDEDYVLSKVQGFFESGVPAINILASLQEGRELVGQRFEKRNTFFPN